MANRSATILKAKNGLNYLRVEFGEVTVSNADTITLDAFDNTLDLLGFYLMKKADGSEMTTTVSNNVVTVTGSGTDVDCWYLAYGYLA